jgi:hypothetical protein
VVEVAPASDGGGKGGSGGGDNGGDAKGNQGDVLAIQFGHVTKRRAVKRASAKVVVGLEPAVELLALMGMDQTDRDSLEKIRFGGQIGATHRKS